MQIELKENRVHGTAEYPYTQYHIHKITRNIMIPVHWHDELELIYVRDGNLSVTISGEKYTCSRDCLCIVNPRELHYMETTDRQVDYFTILFPLEFISFQTNDRYEQDVFMPLRQGKLAFRSYIEKDKVESGMHNLIEKLIQINNVKNELYQMESRVLLLELLIELLRVPDIFTITTSTKTELQRKILNFIRDNYSEKIGLKELAWELHMSDKYLSRYFKESFNITFSKYLNHVRLSNAKKLLETTELSITEVALNCGFPNVSYFISCFRKSYGVTPLMYKNM